MQANEMLEILTDWQKMGLIRAVDLAIAKFLHRRDPASEGEVLLAAALVSYQYGNGHTCLDPDDFLSSPETFLEPPKDQPAPLSLARPLPSDVASRLNTKSWLAKLAASPLVGDGKPTGPLVLDGHRIYLTRNWDHEQRIALEIGNRLEAPTESPADIEATLAILFPDEVSDDSSPKPRGPNWQKISAALASEGRLLILTGGPGTGKTYTVARILALLQKDHPLRILLAAPTGKAAARLSESIASAMTTIPENLRKYAPGKAITIHQMLGASRHGRGYRHDEDTPLQADVVVIDEASMIDLEMMAAILKALQPQTRLILVGDKDQLASVEAGSVLGDLCKDVMSRGYDQKTCDRIQQLSGEILEPVPKNTTDSLAQRTVMLRYSKRFDENSGIGILANAINAGDTTQVLKILEVPPEPKDIRSLALRQDPAPANFREFAFTDGPEPSQATASTIQGYGHYLERLRSTRPAIDAEHEAFMAWSQNVLDSYSRYQILCALRSGPFGVKRINELVEDLLSDEGMIERSGAWYEGRPVMMTRNDYELGIMNGDIGITLAFPNRELTDWILKVAFRNDDGSLKFVLPSRLTEADTVYAMTIHKSQGSEFEHAVLVFPDTTESPIMSRELIYTGVTRAKKRLTVICPRKSDLAESVGRQIHRSGRLSELLRPTSGSGD